MILIFFYIKQVFPIFFNPEIPYFIEETNATLSTFLTLICEKKLLLNYFKT